MTDEPSMEPRTTGESPTEPRTTVESPTESRTTDELAGRTVLVTGGAGFIGSHLAADLAVDNDVRVLDDLSTGRLEFVPDEAAFLEGDVCDEARLREAIEGVDVVFHHAALVSVPQSVEAPERCHEVDATATLRVLEAARRVDARVVFASSAAIYGRPTSLPVREAEPPSPDSPYGVAKLAADCYVRTYADLYGLETVALRYFNVYGPRGSHSDYAGVVGAFLDRVRGGDPLVVHGNGEQTRDFVHVSDVVRANRLAATADATGRAFNVASGESVTIRDLAERIRAAAGTDVSLEHAEARDGDVERSRADLTKARRELDYEPTVPLDEGLASLVDRDV